MNLEKYLEILNSGAHITADSPVHQYMHQVSQEALRLTAELNGSYPYLRKRSARFSHASSESR